MVNILRDAFKKAGIEGSKETKTKTKKDKNDKSKKDKYKYILPRDTLEIISDKCFISDNISLNFYRFVPIPKKEKKLEIWTKLLNSYKTNLKCYKELSKTLKRRLNNIYKQLDEKGFPLKKVTLKTESRLIIGFGIESILEVGLALSHTYGLPCIYGSALKGVCRAFWRKELFSELGYNSENVYSKLQEKGRIERFLIQVDEFLGKAFYFQKILEKNKNDKIIIEAKKCWNEWKNQGFFKSEFEDYLKKAYKFSLAFGSQEMAGALKITDFFPCKNEDLFEIDIINCHYTQYYTKEGLPIEWDKTNPVFFSVIPENVEFRGLIWLELRENLSKDKQSDLLEETISKFCSAVSEFGVGGKTSIGYGRLKLLIDNGS